MQLISFYFFLSNLLFFFKFLFSIDIFPFFTVIASAGVPLKNNGKKLVKDYLKIRTKNAKNTFLKKSRITYIAAMFWTAPSWFNDLAKLTHRLEFFYVRRVSNVQRFFKNLGSINLCLEELPSSHVFSVVRFLFCRHFFSI